MFGFTCRGPQGHCGIEKLKRILAPANINNVGEEVHVMVEGACGRWQVRRRVLFQLGAIQSHIWKTNQNANSNQTA